MTTEAPIIAFPDDISREIATRAFSGTSFVPEKRGEDRRDCYVDAVNSLCADLWKLAATDEQKAALAVEMEQYRQGYIARLTAYLRSRAGLMSTMITGPANFPVERMRKRNAVVDKRSVELLEWSGRAKAAIEKRILGLRPAEVVIDDRWKEVADRIAESLEAIHSIDTRVDTMRSRSMAVDSIVGRTERLAKAGEVDLVGRVVDLVEKYNSEAKKPAISSRSKFWKLADIAKGNVKAKEAAATAGTTTIVESEMAHVVSNPSLDRVQILFADKPDAVVISKLKSQGWNWSPSNQAWQRKLTNAAIYSATQIVA